MGGYNKAESKKRAIAKSKAESYRIAQTSRYSGIKKGARRGYGAISRANRRGYISGSRQGYFRGRRKGYRMGFSQGKSVKRVR